MVDIRKRNAYTVYIRYTHYIHLFRLTKGGETLNLRIRNDSEKPMYEQIKDGIRQAIYQNELKHNEQLPSVRQLAADLNVSAITTKRAYADLEHEGFIYTISGRGTFVKADCIQKLSKLREEQTLSKLRELLKEAKETGLLKREIEIVLNDVYGGDQV